MTLDATADASSAPDLATGGIQSGSGDLSVPGDGSLWWQKLKVPSGGTLNLTLNDAVARGVNLYIYGSTNPAEDGSTLSLVNTAGFTLSAPPITIPPGTQWVYLSWQSARGAFTRQVQWSYLADSGALAVGRAHAAADAAHYGSWPVGASSAGQSHARAKLQGGSYCLTARATGQSITVIAPPGSDPLTAINLIDTNAGALTGDAPWSTFGFPPGRLPYMVDSGQSEYWFYVQTGDHAVRANFNNYSDGGLGPVHAVAFHASSEFGFRFDPTFITRLATVSNFEDGLGHFDITVDLPAHDGAFLVVAGDQGTPRSGSISYDLTRPAPMAEAAGQAWVTADMRVITLHTPTATARGLAHVQADWSGVRKVGAQAQGQASAQAAAGIPGPQIHISGARSVGQATAGPARVSGLIHLPPVTIFGGTVFGAAGFVPDLAGNLPAAIGISLHGDLQLIPPPLPQAQPSRLDLRTMQSIVLSLPSPIIVEGLAMMPAYRGQVTTKATLRVGPHNIHAIPDPDPVYAGGKWFYPPPAATGVGDARWSVQNLPAPAAGSYYWLGDASSLDGTAGIDPGARQWAPDPSTPNAAPWHSFFPYKPSVRATDVYLPSGNVVHHPKGVHFNSHYIEHMWADFGRPTTGPFSWVIAAMVMNYPSGNFTHYLLDAGRNPDSVGFPRLSASAVNTPRTINDGLDYRNLLAVTSNQVLQAARPNLNQGKTVYSRYDNNVRPKMFFSVFNGANSYVGAYDTVARRIQKGATDGPNYGTSPHRFYVMGRSQGHMSQAYAGNFMVFEIRYWNHALSPADLNEQYAQLSSTYKFNEYRAV